MKRRAFIQTSSASLMGLALPDFSFFKGENRMGIVIHSYAFRYGSKVESKVFPAFTNTIDLLEHSTKIGAGGVQVTFNDWKDDYAKSVREKVEKLGLYIEGSIPVPKNESEVVRFEQNIINAKTAGMKVVRTVCSSGRRYEILKKQEEFDLMYKSAIASLQLAEPILRKHQMKLAVENHKDWRADELISIIKTLNSEWIGITLDFGNSMALLEEPMTVVEKLAPYTFTTHVKDMAVEEYVNGFLLSEVPMGKGICDLNKMVEICKKHNPNVTFNLEMITRNPLEIPCFTDNYWATFGKISGMELAKIMQNVKQNKFGGALPRVSQLNSEEKLKAEEDNILACLDFSKEKLGLR